VKHKTRKALALLTGAALSLSLVTLPTFAAEEETAKGSFTNVSEDGGEDYISLCDARSFEAMVPVDLTEEEAKAAAEKVVWSLDYDETSLYVDPAQYPNHTQGGALDTWTLKDGTGNFFTDVKTGVKVQDGTVYLTVNFNNAYYYDLFTDLPKNMRGYQTNGGTYLDLSGWYDLTATADGKTLGSVGGVKITPYDDFHTMKEIYESIDELVAFGKENTDLYVERFSMGKSQGDNGMDSLDMPYLIIAKDRAAVDNWQKLKAEAESDPAAVLKKLEKGTLGDYQVPVLYSNIHSNEVAAPDGVLKFAQLLLESAASKEGSVDYKTLTGFTKEGEAALTEQLGPKGVKDSIAVPDLVADKATYLGFLKGQVVDGKAGDGTVKEGTASPWDTSVKVDFEKYYTVETVTVDIDELLSDVFFLIVPEENVEGRTYVTRTSSGGFDLNRDNSFQTQAETQNMTHFISQWNPVSFTEFHGQHKEFQCEPCDPPHEPNFEYDLLAEHLMTGGEALGIAAVANNSVFNSYSIPQRDYLSYTGEKNADGSDQVVWADPWDDMSTSYTPQYSMLHGTVAYTVELPSHNDDAVDLVVYGQLGQSKYIADNKESYFTNQVKLFQRGVTNANSNAYDLVGQWFCDVHDVEGAEAELFRPVYDGEGQNGNFYPECYIIPLDGANQKNLQAADEMIEYLVRNGVTVSFTTEAVTYDGVEYPAGTAVVSMYQAKRSVANGVLYDGTVITGWPVLYSEGITAFGKTRGFDMAVCAEPAAYKEIDAVCVEGTEWTVASDKVDSQQVILNNTSTAAVAAVNELLKAGKSVSVITAGESKGSFLVSKADYESVSGKYLLTAKAVEGAAPAAKALTKAPVIYISGKPAEDNVGFIKTTLVSGAYEYNYDRQSMALMGFETTDDASKADLIVGAAALDEQAMAAVKAGTPYIGYGRRAIPSAAELFGEGELVREVVSDESMDALAYVTYPTESMITASYVSEGDDILYGYGAGYFAAIPEGAKVLVKLDGSKDLMEGFLCADGEHYADFLNDSIQAISYQKNGLDLVLFANTLTNKVHQHDEFGFIANAAFAAVAAGYDDVADDAWYAETVDAVTAAGLMTGTGANTFSPEAVVTRETVATVLYRNAGSPAVSDEAKAKVAATSSIFSDAVEVSSWAVDAMAWAVENGLLQGSGNKLMPQKDITRQELAVLFYRNAGAPAVTSDELAGFADNAAVAAWAADGAEWCVEQGILNGTGTAVSTFSPEKTATRVELAAMLVRAL